VPVDEAAVFIFNPTALTQRRNYSWSDLGLSEQEEIWVWPDGENVKRGSLEVTCRHMTRYFISRLRTRCERNWGGFREGCQWI
jgi:hypothetical protein